MLIAIEYYNYCVSFQRLSFFTRLEQKIDSVLLAQMKCLYINCMGICCAGGPLHGPWLVSYAFKLLKCQGQSPVVGFRRVRTPESYSFTQDS